MKENPRYKKLYFNSEPITVKKTSAMGITEISKFTSKRRAKKKIGKKSRRLNRKRG